MHTNERAALPPRTHANAQARLAKVARRFSATIAAAQGGIGYELIVAEHAIANIVLNGDTMRVHAFGAAALQTAWDFAREASHAFEVKATMQCAGSPQPRSDGGPFGGRLYANADLDAVTVRTERAPFPLDAEAFRFFEKPWAYLTRTLGRVDTREISIVDVTPQEAIPNYSTVPAPEPAVQPPWLLLNSDLDDDKTG